MVSEGHKGELKVIVEGPGILRDTPAVLKKAQVLWVSFEDI